MSRGTVSRVLNGAHNVSPEALAKVTRAMRQTGYVVNHSARVLATGRADAVGFLLSEPQERLFEDPTFNVLLRSATLALAKHDVALVLLLAGREGSERILRYIRAGHVDGLLLISAHAGDPMLAQLAGIDMPMVMAGRSVGPAQAVPYVAADDVAGGRLMTQYLLSRGCRRIGMITGPLDTPGGTDRLAGYHEVLGERFTEARVVSAETWSHDAGEAAMRELWSREQDIDAVFAASDLLASGALAFLRDRGVRVPDEIAVGGFDDSQVATSSRPTLTTVRQPLSEVAVEMTEVLLARINGQEVTSSRILPVKLIRRESA